jgi:deoxyribonuclease V
MESVRLHDWAVTTSDAKGIQLKLAPQVSRQGRVDYLRCIAGVDISVNRWTKTGTAAVVVLTYPGFELVEVQVVTGSLDFPYVPGLLTFREAPLTLAACEKLRVTPGLFIVDGQGIAHPRRVGLASHLGLCLDVPTIGCAKSRLCGRHTETGNKAGSFTDLVDGDEVIGAVLRTRTGVKPVYVSIGHRIDLAGSISWVLKCCRGYRLPEPTRLAHQAAVGNLKETIGTAMVEEYQK